MADVATRTTNLVVESFEQDDILLDDGGPDCWYVCIEETYSGDHPTFRTERLVFDVHNEESTTSVVFDITPRELLRMGLALINAGTKMMDQAAQNGERHG